MLQRGDRLLLTPTLQPGVPAKLDKAGRVRHPATIGCTLPEAFEDVRVGDAIWLDDGKIGGKVEHNDAAGLTIRILHARPDGEKLRGDKGINLPDSELRLPAMTGRDRADLRFVVEHADLVAMSFANSPQDIADLIKEIDRIGNRRPGIIIKVETRWGFENLPGMLFEAMRTPACGVMIARGDLAVGRVGDALAGPAADSFPSHLSPEVRKHPGVPKRGEFPKIVPGAKPRGRRHPAADLLDVELGSGRPPPGLICLLDEIE